MSKIASTKKLSLERELIVSGKPEDMYTFQKRLSKELSEMYEVLAQAINNLRTDFDAFNGTWTDYSATSTIVGWASFTAKLIYYKKIGNTVFVNVNIAGTSNATNVTFTLPYTSKNVTEYTSYSGAYAIDSGTATAGGLLGLSPNSSTASGYSTMAGAAWTNSGTKAIHGQFWYEVEA